MVYVGPQVVAKPDSAGVQAGAIGVLLVVNHVAQCEKKVDRDRITKEDCFLAETMH